MFIIGGMRRHKTNIHLHLIYIICIFATSSKRRRGPGGLPLFCEIGRRPFRTAGFDNFKL